MEGLLNKQQNIRFSGAGASHQNGAAERAVKTEFNMENIQVMHASLRCPEETLTTDIWTMEIDYAV